jgi:hypothetical protein
MILHVIHFNESPYMMHGVLWLGIEAEQQESCFEHKIYLCSKMCILNLAHPAACSVGTRGCEWSIWGHEAHLSPLRSTKVKNVLN